MQVVRMKELQRAGVCPKAQQERELAAQREEEEKARREQEAAAFLVADLIELYLTEVIEDRMIKDARTGKPKRVAGSRKPKGQAEVRRTLYNDPVRVLGDMPAGEVTRKHVVDLVREILARGANVQAGNVLREDTLFQVDIPPLGFADLTCSAACPQRQPDDIFLRYREPGTR